MEDKEKTVWYNEYAYDPMNKNQNECHFQFFLQSPHWAEFPLAVGFPVLRDLWHCLQRSTPQFLQLTDEDDPQPDEYLHIFWYQIIIKYVRIELNKNL